MEKELPRNSGKRQLKILTLLVRGLTRMRVVALRADLNLQEPTMRCAEHMCDPPIEDLELELEPTNVVPRGPRPRRWQDERRAGRLGGLRKKRTPPPPRAN